MPEELCAGHASLDGRQSPRLLPNVSRVKELQGNPASSRLRRTAYMQEGAVAARLEEIALDQRWCGEMRFQEGKGRSFNVEKMEKKRGYCENAI